MLTFSTFKSHPKLTKVLVDELLSRIGAQFYHPRSGQVRTVFLCVYFYYPAHLLKSCKQYQNKKEKRFEV